MFLVPTDTPGRRTSCATSASAASRSDEGSHALIHYDDVRVPADALLGGEGQAFAIAQTRLGGGRIHHAMRTIGLAQQGARHDVRAGPQPRDAGQPAGRQAVRAGLHRRLLRPAHAVPAVRALHRVDDRQAQRLPQGPQGHRRGEGADAGRAARHRLAGHAGPRRPRRQQRDAVPRDDARRQRDGPGRRAHRGPQGHRRPAGAARPQAQRRPLAHPAPAQAAGRGPRRSTPSTSSTRWGTCDRHRPARRLAGRRGPARARASRSRPRSSPAAPRTRSTRSAAATCTARCASRRRRRPRRRDEGILREWRIIEALDGTDVPHTAGHRRRAPTRPCSAAPST